MTIKKGTTTIAVDGSPYWGSLEGNISEHTDLYNILNSKAPSLSPALTGIPTAPTAPDGTNTTQIATTEFVKTAIQDIDALPDQTDMEGKYLATDGVNAYWKSPAGLPLLSFIWSDHILNDSSFLRSDTFSWQSGSVYKSAYEHLVEDYNSGTMHTDTIGGVSVIYKLCSDGHKICTESEMVNVEEFYAVNGSAWYYILDTTNQRFKLPRTKYGFVGVRTIPGEIVAQNVSGVIDSENIVTETSNEMYLYFYLGNSIRNETTIDVGEITEALDGKLDQDLSNVSSEFSKIVSGFGMPSNVYEDLTLGTSGTTYTAPANGYVTISKMAGFNGVAFLRLCNNTAGIESQASPTGDWITTGLFVPVKKGDVFEVTYNLTGQTWFFRFVYAEGEI